MKQCLIYDSSLRFPKAIFGILALIAFLLHNHWLVLTASLLMVLGAFSTKFNILYQFHALVLRKLLRDKSEPIQKESGELTFTHGMGGTLFYIGFLFLYFGKFVGFAWCLVLIVALLMLLAGIGDICVAASIYAVFKKIFKR